jgi:signal peptidase I
MSLSIFLIAVAFGTRTYLWQPFSMPSTSMEPGTMLGDHFFVSKYAYGPSHPPERGDIAVFWLPKDASVAYIKRIVGLPGDRIQMKAGVLHINGAPVKRESVALPAQFAGNPEGVFYRETLPNGRSYVIAERSDEETADNTDEYVVPEGRYFAMGDNRDNSQDSRFINAVGFIPEANFIGRKAITYWNSEGFPLEGRPEED